METLRADKLLPMILEYLTEPVEIATADGIPLGRFTPDPARVEQLRAQMGHVLDAAEIARQQQAEGPPHTTREVFEHLLTLAEHAEDQADLNHWIEEIKKRDGCSTP